MTPSASTRNVLGISIEALTMEQALDAADRAIQRRERLLIGVVNAAKIVNMQRDRVLSDAVRTADMIFADGMSVVWASRLLRQRLPERVAGIDLMTRLLERGDERGYRVFCLGATDEVLQTVVQRIAIEHPNVKVVGARNGYYKEAEDQQVAEQIKAARPDMLFAAMTSPKKEVFLARWADFMGVPVCHGVGGAFDVLAGKVQRAPRLWQACGMEWLYRVAQEPGRLWKRYLVTNTAFCAMVARELATGLFASRRPATLTPVRVRSGK